MSISMTERKPAFHIQPRHLLLVGLLTLAFYVLLPQLGDFRSSWQLLRHPDALFTALAVLLTFGTYAAGAGTYCFLAFRPLSFSRTLLVQFAAMFVNRLLPAGLGAVGVNYLYLRHARHKTSQAVSVVAINNLLGFMGHGLILLVTILVASGTSSIQPVHHGSNQTRIIGVVASILAILMIFGLIYGHHKVTATLKDTKTQLLSYRLRPLSLIGALCTSVALTLCNVLALACCMHALGLILPFAVVVLVFTFGISAGAAVPTPGGLGGFEAGLAAGFVAYGIDPAPALATALLYRLVSYWLPIMAGLLAFIVCQKRRLFSVA